MSLSEVCRRNVHEPYSYGSYIVMVNVVMAYVVMAYAVMAYVVMAVEMSGPGLGSEAVAEALAEFAEPRRRSHSAAAGVCRAKAP